MLKAEKQNRTKQKTNKNDHSATRARLPTTMLTEVTGSGSKNDPIYFILCPGLDMAEIKVTTTTTAWRRMLKQNSSPGTSSVSAASM